MLVGHMIQFIGDLRLDFVLSFLVLVNPGRVQNKRLALSGTEAEYMAIVEASKQAIYLRNIFAELTGNLNCIKLFNNDQSTQKLLTNPIFQKRFKHLDIRRHSIRDVIANRSIRLEYLQTAHIPAGILQKNWVLLNIISGNYRSYNLN